MTLCKETRNVAVHLDVADLQLHARASAAQGWLNLNTRLRRGLALASNLAVLAVFVYAVQHFWGWGRLLAPWQRLPLGVVLLAAGGLLISYLVRATRIYMAEDDIPRGQLGQCLRLILLSNAFNLLLPMRSGEASFPLLMRRWFGIEIGRATGILIWLRLLDLHVLAAVGVVCAAAGWLGRNSIAADWAPLVAALCVAAPVMLFILRKPLTQHLQGRGGRVAGLLAKVLTGLPVNMRGLLRDLGLTWLSWTIKLAGLGWVLSRLANLSPALGVLGAIGGDLSTVLPIHAPGGFGTYEAGVLILLSPASAPTPALLAAAVDLHLLVLTTALLAAAIAWIAPGPRRQP